MLLGTFVLRVSTAVTGGMLAYYLADLGLHPVDVGNLHTTFYITEVVGSIAFGILADRVGRKLVMILGPIFGGVAVFLTGLSSFMPVLLSTRLLEGASTAASIPSTLGFVAAETSHDPRLRGRVVSIFELATLAGLFAVGPAVAGALYVLFHREAFFLNVLLYVAAFACYAYGVTETKVPRAVLQGQTPPTPRRYVEIMTNRQVLLFAPTWIAINAILAVWATQAPFLLTGKTFHDPSQFLLQGVKPDIIGFGQAGLAVFFGLGVLFWGGQFARFRRTTMLLWGVAAFALACADILAINHLGQISPAVLGSLVAVLLFSLFILSGATPVALGFLADVSERFREDRGAIMGLYSVFLGLGQVVGSQIAGHAAAWRGIDGLVAATAVLIVVALLALLNLRAHEDFAPAPSAHPEPSALGALTVLTRRNPPSNAPAKEQR